VAAGLGCRFATSYRAVVHHGRAAPGQWLAVYGCGGVGLAAIMIAVSRGMRVVAVDVSGSARALAVEIGAEASLDAGDPDAPAQILEMTGGGAHLTIDAFGRAATFAGALAALRPRGRHVQIGLLLGGDAAPSVDMGRVISRELEIVGSHGMAAHDYPALLAEVASGALRPGRLVTRTIPLAGSPAALAAMGEAHDAGTTVVVL
jgi:alcohol dehydrogenase